MKNVFIVLLVVAAATPSVAQAHQAYQPQAAVSLVLVDSLAFVGLGGEVFLGNLGVGGTITVFGFGTRDGFVFLYEPGVYGRLYWSNPRNAFFLMCGLSWFNATIGTGKEVWNFDSNVVNLNTGLGYNVFFGDDNGARFSFEVGPRYTFLADDPSAGFLFVHVALMFGKTF